MELAGVRAKTSELTFQNLFSTCTTPHRIDSAHITMFGPFRLTNPLSGGLLWYAIHL
jgi:hypothetical protein